MDSDGGADERIVGIDAGYSRGRSGHTVPGTPPPDITELARMEDRTSFAYFEHCKVTRADNAITVIDEKGTTHIPAATLGVLMLGPGVSITHSAMAVIGENGATVVWVGERGVRMYAFGKPLTHSSRLLQQQARLVSNNRSRLAVARSMYQMRFPGEDVAELTMQQLRGREGARIRKVYKSCSARYGVPWDGRSYRPDDYSSGSPINMALTAAHQCLYGVAHSVIVGIGCSPGLGFVRTGHEKSFVYDIADLYKAETSIPVAFATVAERPDDVASATRHNMRDSFYGLSLMSRMVRDVRRLLGDLGDEGPEDRVALWDERDGEVRSGVSYGEVEPWS